MKTKAEKKIKKIRNKMRPVHLTATLGMICELDFKARLKLAWLIFHGGRKYKPWSLKTAVGVFAGLTAGVYVWFILKVAMLAIIELG